MQRENVDNQYLIDFQGNNPTAIFPKQPNRQDLNY